VWKSRRVKQLFLVVEYVCERTKRPRVLTPMFTRRTVEQARRRGRSTNLPEHLNHSDQILVMA